MSLEAGMELGNYYAVHRGQYNVEDLSGIINDF